MKKIVSVVSAAVAAVTMQAEIILSQSGTTRYTIVYDLAQNDVLLNPAVQDLADYLKKITGAEFKIAKSASGPAIYIGKTAPGDKQPFASRERRIKSVGDDLYIYGDYRYGTSGAIYNFLSEFCGCRWYTMDGDEKVPQNPDLKFAAFDYSRVPSFKSYEFGSRSHMDHNPAIMDWMRRNNGFPMPNYSFGQPNDGWTYIGPVTHTLAAYIPPIPRKPRTFNDDLKFFAGPHPCLADKAYFAEHPEYFTLNAKGERVKDMQVCFSNPEVRKLLLENVQKVITAEKYDPSQDAILDFTQNDRIGGFCYCPGCKKLNEKYSTPGGAYFDFLKEMGEYFAPKYPRLTFRFFSYKEDMTGVPPKNFTFPDNMSVIIAPLQQDFSKPLSHEYNERFLRQMEEWSKLCKEIWFWNYPTLYTFGIQIYSNFPGVYRNSENLQLAHRNRVRYIIGEQGGSMHHTCSFKELNSYVMARQTEDINVNVEDTIKEFCDACYGKASDKMIEYLKEMDADCKEDPGFFIYWFSPSRMKLVHGGATLGRGQKAFNEMEKLVAKDARALFNVRRARLALDAVTILRYPVFAASNPELAKTETLDHIYKRYCRYVKADSCKHNERDDRGPSAGIGEAKSFIDNGVKMPYLFFSTKCEFPEELVKKYGKDNLIDVMPFQARRAPAYNVKGTAHGYACRVPYTKDKLGVRKVRVITKGGYPWNDMSYEYFKSKKSLLDPSNRKEYEKVKGFKCYYAGRLPLTAGGLCSVTTVPTRSVQFYLGEYFNERFPNQKYDFYFSLKDAGDGKTMWLDRLIIAKAK